MAKTRDFTPEYRAEVVEKMFSLVTAGRDLWNGCLHIGMTDGSYLVKHEPGHDWYVLKCQEKEFFNHQVVILYDWMKLFNDEYNYGDGYWPSDDLYLDENNLPAINSQKVFDLDPSEKFRMVHEIMDYKLP